MERKLIHTFHRMTSPSLSKETNPSFKHSVTPWNKKKSAHFQCTLLNFKDFIEARKSKILLSAWEWLAISFEKTC